MLGLKGLNGPQWWFHDGFMEEMWASWSYFAENSMAMRSGEKNLYLGPFSSPTERFWVNFGPHEALWGLTRFFGRNGVF